ncbi:hypothetical protein KP509_21G085800 [Ceratopteris richardii]|uniref:Uncharacterized protein n=1 Tax=Ceratopteris richardii TaxID=49495 RepID=A0A8T2SFB2_CERRI|nr:hypothetical protein KP509_21G085800 [Ceratopteris richardii]
MTSIFYEHAVEEMECLHLEWLKVLWHSAVTMVVFEEITHAHVIFYTLSAENNWCAWKNYGGSVQYICYSDVTSNLS